MHSQSLHALGLSTLELNNLFAPIIWFQLSLMILKIVVCEFRRPFDLFSLCPIPGMIVLHGKIKECHYTEE